LSSDLIQNIKKDIHQQAIYIGCLWLKNESLNQVTMLKEMIQITNAKKM